ncbi:MAG: outer membrane beta-barrel protein [Kiritimatiellae bacterium]|nr:outer membrane beta-barrel protein [Kiritimatiellia bacterium]
MKAKTAMAAAMAAVLGMGAWAARGDIGVGVLAGYWDTPDIPADVDGFGGITARVEAELLPILGVEARLGGYGMSDDWEEWDGREWTDYEVQMDVVSVEAGLSLNLPLGLATLYGGGGVGAYFPDGRVETWENHRKHRVDLDFDPEVGFYAFAGGELSLGPNVALVGELRYTWLEADVEAERNGWLDAEDGKVDLGGFGVEVGLMFWL